MQNRPPGASHFSPGFICLISSLEPPRSIFVAEAPSQFIDYLSPDLTPKPQASIFNHLLDIHFVFHLDLKPNTNEKEILTLIGSWKLISLQTSPAQ